MIEKLKKNNLLSITIGIVYLWFGALKFIPELSPAEGLAIDTIDKIIVGLIPSNVTIILLAVMEVVIGFSFLLNIFKKPMIKVALGHLAFTFTPLFFFSEQSFNGNPVALTLVGQYIIKNLVIVAALLSLLKMEKKTKYSFNSWKY